MGFALSPDAEAAGFRLQSFETIGSTNTEALSRARAGERGPVWLVSRHQSAGRGRRGSVWATDRGNLAATLLRVVDLPPATIANLGFVAGLALMRALERCSPASFEAGLRPAPQDEERLGNCNAPHAEVRAPASLEARTTFALKWPNDVLAGDAKIAGILLETEALPGGGQAVAIGIGVNVSSAPDGVPYPITCLRALGCASDPEGLFAALSSIWIETEALWNGGFGFARVRRLWLDHASGLGGPIRVRMPNRTLNGTFETIDETGRLLVRGPDGALTPIAAGEIFFPNMAEA